MKKVLFILGLILVSSQVAFAKGDAEAGKAKTIVCTACHGSDGNSAIAINPKLAGQHAKYTAKQLQEFKLASQTGGKEGRNNAVMNGFAATLSNQDMLNIAAYFAAQKQSPGATPEEFIAAGEVLYRGGNKARGIAACSACHGPSGNGTSLSGFPDISGQHVEYTKTQLKAFRSGERNNDANGMMRDVASKLTDEDIEILANYLAGLH